MAFVSYKTLQKSLEVCSRVPCRRMSSAVVRDVMTTLRARGFVNQTTNDIGIKKHLEKPRVVYAGFDPTADSLHLGNLLVIMALRHFQDHGHKPLCLIGGATGLIGDPSGRSTERPLMDNAALRTNTAGIANNLKTLLRFDESETGAKLLNNVTWYAKMSALEYLRDLGQHFRMASMLAKDSVQTRLNSAEGMSYMEFSYQTLQAHDFFHLRKVFKCTIQLGGSDQYGNITAGTDYVRKRTEGKGLTYGITLPLLTTSSGAKFGKSAGNAIWLARDKTSPFQVYQYFLNTSDADVEPYLKLFTLLPLEAIAELSKTHNERPQDRVAQKALAFSVTSLLHGEEEAKQAETASKELFSGGSGAALSAAVLEGFPNLQAKASEVIGQKLCDFLALRKVVSSKKEFHRLVASGGMYLNGVRLEDPSQALSQADFPASVDGTNVCVVRIGKKSQTVIVLTP